MKGFKAAQIQALGMVRWQAQLLEQDAESMREFLRLSLTVENETNHKIVLANHDKYIVSYGKRAQSLLRSIRVAQKSIQ